MGRSSTAPIRTKYSRSPQRSRRAYPAFHDTDSNHLVRTLLHPARADTSEVAAAALIALIVVGWLAGVVVLAKGVGRVWRGEAVRWLPIDGFMTSRSPKVTSRSFPAWALSIFWFWTACGLLAESAVKGPTAAIHTAGGVCGGLWLLSFPLWLVVNGFNRPRFLVPPGRRHERGSFAESRARRRAGAPPTDHPVEILDVRPRVGDSKPHPPYFVAVCTAADCDWMSDVVDQDTGPDAVDVVRAQAHGHSDVLIGPRRPVG